MSGPRFGTAALRRATAAARAAAVAAFIGIPAALADGERYRPADSGATVLVLPAALAAGSAPFAAASDPEAAARRAEELADLARSSRDVRYFGRAQAQLTPWIARSDATPRLLVVAADLAQQRHDFARGRELLDRALAVAPGNAGARLMRANLLLITGEFGAARADCAAVIQAGSAFEGTICLASALTGRGSLARARRLLATLGVADRIPAAIGRWRNFTEADLALRDGDTDAAVAWLERAASLDPAHDETRARLAEALLARGEDGRALAVTAGPNGSAALLAARVRAASREGAALAAATRRDFNALIEVSHRRGGAIHWREEGLVALHADHDARRALELGWRNFELQKDTPDLRLLVDAAVAADDRPTLAYLRHWLDSTGFEDRVADARLRAAGV